MNPCTCNITTRVSTREGKILFEDNIKLKINIKYRAGDGDQSRTQT